LTPEAKHFLPSQPRVVPAARSYFFIVAATTTPTKWPADNTIITIIISNYNWYATEKLKTTKVEDT
jgi:hypothetical protein